MKHMNPGKMQKTVEKTVEYKKTEMNKKNNKMKR